MRELLISQKADEDLLAIAQYTVEHFGAEQARKYRDQFKDCFVSLLTNPGLGRSANDLAPGLRSIRQQAHIIFYMPSAYSILIVRVLHAAQDFARQFEK